MQIFQACYTAKRGILGRLFKTAEMLSYPPKMPLSLSALPEDKDLGENDPKIAAVRSEAIMIGI